MVAAMHAKDPSVLVSPLLQIFPEILPGRIHLQFRIVIVRNDSKKRLYAVAVHQILETQKLLPVHVGCNVIQPDCNSQSFHLTDFLYTSQWQA